MSRGRWIALLLLGLAFAQAAGEYAVSGRVVYEARGPIGAFEGENRKVGGTLVWDAASGEASGRICVDLSAWDSGEPLRDKHTRAMFEVERYPEACFQLQGVRQGEAAGELILVGALSIHGITHPLEIPGKVREEGGRVFFEGQFETRITDWGMKRPSMMGFKVRDRVKVRVYGEGVPR